MNPFDHSQLAADIFDVIVDSDDLDLNTQHGEGTLACRIADMLVKSLKLKIKPRTED